MTPLRAKRQAAGLSLRQLAARVGMTAERLCRLELEQTWLRVDDVLRIAAELGCEASEIMPPVVRRTKPDNVA